MLRCKWERLKSGLYVPLFLKRLHGDEFGGWPPCPECCDPPSACEECSDGGPDQFQVFFTGLVNGGCGDCTYFNDPSGFILTRPTSPGFCTDPGCMWTYQLPVAKCAMQYISACFDVGRFRVEPVVLLTEPRQPLLGFFEDFGSPPSCKTFNNRDIPYSVGSVDLVRCSVSSPTCKTTAL